MFRLELRLGSGSGFRVLRFKVRIIVRVSGFGAKTTVRFRVRDQGWV